MIVAITNLKGGVGKTTTAMALASAAVASGYKARVIDADTQGSSTEWAYLADEENGEGLPFSVDPANLANITRLRSKDDEWVFIDCPPTGKVNDEAVKVADFVIVPTTPSEVDMRQTWTTVKAIEKSDAAYAVLVVRRDKRTVTFREVWDALEKKGASYFETSIPQREAVKNTFGGTFDEYFGYEDVFGELQAVFNEKEEVE